MAGLQLRKNRAGTELATRRGREITLSTQAQAPRPRAVVELARAEVALESFEVNP